MDYYFPILSWRNNYDQELKNSTDSVRQILTERPIDFSMEKTEIYINYCICCYRYFKYSTKTTLEYNRKVNRYFVRGGGYGSYWETYTFGFVDRTDEPEWKGESFGSEWIDFCPGHEICDLCVLEFLEDKILKVVHIQSLGDVTPDLGTFSPSMELIYETCSKLNCL